ncbi:MAG: asparaginase [Bacteroidia bacterium]
MKKEKAKVLLIYTGGTVGMVQDEKTGVLKPFSLESIIDYIPELSRFGIRIDGYSFEPPIDSSNMKPEIWIQLADIIGNNYTKYDGFVVLHGSDTMAYTASALSFLLENLGKPVILTGSQLPVNVLRSDAQENIIVSIEIAAAKEKGKAKIPEVCVYFENHLYRGNRTYKHNAENFDAFNSSNYPELATAGVHIKYNDGVIAKPPAKKLVVHQSLDTNIAIVKLFPGTNPAVLESIFNTKGLKAVVLETYGTGNAPTDNTFLKPLEKAAKKGIILLNVTQCRAGAVQQGRYETSTELKKIGIISGADMTTETAVAKLMFLLGENYRVATIKKLLQQSLRGELTI